MYGIFVGNEITFDPERIFNEQRSYFCKLYTESKACLTIDRKYCQNIKELIPRISSESKELCDLEIDMDEVTGTNSLQ